jgi:hypothetical protein
LAFLPGVLALSRPTPSHGPGHECGPWANNLIVANRFFCTEGEGLTSKELNFTSRNKTVIKHSNPNRLRGICERKTNTLCNDFKPDFDGIVLGG